MPTFISQKISNGQRACLECGSILGRVKPKTMQLIFVASPQHSGERAKTGWLGIRIMCPSRATCPPAECFFGKLALKIQLSVLV